MWKPSFLSGSTRRPGLESFAFWSPPRRVSCPAEGSRPLWQAPESGTLPSNQQRAAQSLGLGLAIHYLTP